MIQNSFFNVPSSQHHILGVESVNVSILERQRDDSDALTLLHDKIQCEILHEIICVVVKGLQ